MTLLILVTQGFAIPKAYDLLQAYNLNSNLEKDIESVFVGETPTFYNQFYGNTKLNAEKQEEASYIWDEDIYNFFNEIAPDGFYFGSSEGDGACFGFFKYEEEEEDKIEDALDKIAERVRDGYKSGICGNGVTWSIEINI